MAEFGIARKNFQALEFTRHIDNHRAHPRHAAGRLIERNHPDVIFGDHVLRAFAIPKLNRTGTRASQMGPARSGVIRRLHPADILIVQPKTLGAIAQGIGIPRGKENATRPIGQDLRRYICRHLRQ